MFRFSPWPLTVNDPIDPRASAERLPAPEKQACESRGLTGTLYLVGYHPSAIAPNPAARNRLFGVRPQTDRPALLGAMASARGFSAYIPLTLKFLLLAATRGFKPDRVVAERQLHSGKCHDHPSSAPFARRFRRSTLSNRSLDYNASHESVTVQRSCRGTTAPPAKTD